jgi:hypothetical protein
MNELALIKIQSKVMGLDRELHQAVNDLISSKSSISDEHLTVIINSTERELRVYDHILKLLINNQKVN